MSGTKAIIASLFPRKEPAPNKGNKSRVWHRLELCKAHPNRDLGAGATKDAHGKGRRELCSAGDWNLLDLSLEFPSWSRRGDKNPDFSLPGLGGVGTAFPQIPPLILLPLLKENQEGLKISTTETSRRKYLYKLTLWGAEPKFQIVGVRIVQSWDRSSSREPLAQGAPLAQLSNSNTQKW